MSKERPYIFDDKIEAEMLLKGRVNHPSKCERCNHSIKHVNLIILRKEKMYLGEDCYQSVREKVIIKRIMKEGNKRKIRNLER